MEIVGERDLPKEFHVDNDGTVELPYVRRVKVAGLEPQAVSDLVRRRLAELKIRDDATVVLAVTQYNSKRISVIGQVQNPGSFPFKDGMSLVDALSTAGGFTAIANRNRVTVTRSTRGGKPITVMVSLGDIIDGRAPDVPMQSGDKVYVDERIF